MTIAWLIFAFVIGMIVMVGIDYERGWRAGYAAAKRQHEVDDVTGL